MALSEMLSKAVRLPLAFGLNVILTVQAAPEDKDLPHVAVWRKSPGLAPVIATWMLFKVAVPVLLSVAVCPALLVPTAWLPNEKLGG